MTTFLRDRLRPSSHSMEDRIWIATMEDQSWEDILVAVTVAMDLRVGFREVDMDQVLVLVVMAMLDMQDMELQVAEDLVTEMNISQPIQGDRTQPPTLTGISTVVAEEDLDIKSRVSFSLLFVRFVHS